MPGDQVSEGEVQVGGETTKVCPACQALLSDAAIQGKPVLYCAKCRGMLVSIDKFLPLVEFLRALRRPSGSTLEPRDNSDADRQLSCPECAQTMVGYPYGGPGNVNLDSCERCSVIWLDYRELWRIVQAPDHYPVYSSYDGVST